MIDWDAVKSDYTSGVPVSQIADKYNCSRQYIYKKANKGGWDSERQIAIDRDKKVDTVIICKPPMDGTTEEMLEVVIGLTRTLKDAVSQGCDPSSVQGYAQSIKSLQQTYSSLVGTQYMLDLEKIDALKRQYQVVNDDAETGVIVMPDIREE